MAIIALLDWDLCRWRQPTVFSLELMKLAYYHKVKERDIVQMITAYNTEKVSKLYIWKDYEDYSYPELIMKDPKVQWGGLALSNGIYSALPPEIENCPADTSIYEPLFKYYKRTSNAKQIHKNMLKAYHLRLSLDGKTVNVDWEKQLSSVTGRVQHVILHDKDIINVRDAYSAISYIGNKYGRKNVRLGFKFPVNITNPEDLVIWGDLTKSTDLANLNLYDIMPDEVIENISINKQQFTYVINRRFWTYEKFLKEIPRILLQGMFLSKWAITISLKVEKDFILEEEWLQCIEMLNNYFRSCVLYRNRLVFCGFTYCKYCYGKLQEPEKINLFKFLKDKQPEFFDLLYGTEYVSFENNKFIPHMYTWGEIEKGGGYGGYYYQQGKIEKNQPVQLNYADFILPEQLYLE